MTRVFIDGESGTTGLRLRSRLEGREGFELISLEASERKNPEARREAMKRAEITVLCLPDAAAREAAALSEGTGTRLADASTAHRTDPAWVYGMPELTRERSSEIASAARVAVPGCHATGMVMLTAPLVRASLLPPDFPFAVTSLTGYTGGGKKMIAEYESPERKRGDRLSAPRPYGLSQMHKHLPEVQMAAGLSVPPVFFPVVGDFACGMLVSVPLNLRAAGLSRSAVLEAYRTAYEGMPLVSVLSDEELQEAPGFLNASAMAGRDSIALGVIGNEERVTLTALFDNLGKGASGTAIECINLMTGRPAEEGLVI